MGILFYNSLFSAIAMFLFFAIEHYNISIENNNNYNNLNQFSNINDINNFQATSRMLRGIDEYQNEYQNFDHQNNQNNLNNNFNQNNNLNQNNHTLHNIFPEIILPHSSPGFGAQIQRNLMQSTITKIYYYDNWNNLNFLLMFTCAALLGSVLNYSIFVCTSINSALTTAVVGCLKNVLTTYIGMMIFSDYTFSWWNFIGINISIAGSLYYTYVTMFKGSK